MRAAVQQPPGVPFRFLPVAGLLFGLQYCCARCSRFTLLPCLLLGLPCGDPEIASRNELLPLFLSLTPWPHSYAATGLTLQKGSQRVIKLDRK